MTDTSAPPSPKPTGAATKVAIGVIVALAAGLALNSYHDQQRTTHAAKGSKNPLNFEEYFRALKDGFSSGARGVLGRPVRITDESNTIMLMLVKSGCSKVRAMFEPGSSTELPDGVRVICHEDEDGEIWAIDRR